MTTPVRMRLSRVKGSNLQATSLALNGLPCISVARPGPYGNYAGSTKADFDRDLAEMSNADRATMHEKAKLLRGNNIACWCSLDAECHADTWLELANQEQSHDD